MGYCNWARLNLKPNKLDPKNNGYGSNLKPGGLGGSASRVQDPMGMNMIIEPTQTKYNNKIISL